MKLHNKANPSSPKTRPAIRLLPDDIKTHIAAGEVVEGAFSVVKELVENSLDSEAGRIHVEIEEGGRSTIRVVDDGQGIPAPELPQAILEHATSKISSTDDLFQINTLGFRGEALSSIVAISHFLLRSRTREQQAGFFVQGEGGSIQEQGSAAMDYGTEVRIENLFYNTPARRKFLKSTQAETRRIREILSRLALAHPQVQFYLISNGKSVLRLEKRDSLWDRVEDLYGKELREHLLEISGYGAGVHLWGVISLPSYAKQNRAQQIAYVNGRPVELPYFSFYLKQAYDGYLESGRFPVAFVFVEAEPRMVDVNVHPTKREVRFRNQKELNQTLLHILSSHLRERDFAHLDKGYSMDRTGPAPSSAPQNPLPQGQPWEPGEGQTPRAPYIPSGPEADSLLFLGESGEIAWSNQTATIRDYSVTLINKDYRVVGQILGKYILLEQPNEPKRLLFVDFHAAHERIQFERMVKKRDLYSGSQGAMSERLLVPEVMDLSPEEMGLVEENLEHFARVGLEVDVMGPHSIQIASLPYFIKGNKLQETLSELLAMLGQEKTGDVDLEREYLRHRACKVSIRAGHQLTDQEIEILLQDLSACDEPTRCPHGRPVLVGMGDREMDRLFKRIV